MSKIALFPGSFDPITKGHEALVNRALPLFDKIIIAIGTNSQKNYMFDLEKRITMIKQTFGKEPKVVVEKYEGLTVDFCKKMNAGFILRGLRNSSDFEFEKNIAQMNSALVPGIESVFIITSPELSPITSTVVREILKYGGNVRPFVPSAVTL